MVFIEKLKICTEIEYLAILSTSLYMVYIKIYLEPKVYKKFILHSCLLANCTCLHQQCRPKKKKNLATSLAS